MSTPSQVFSPPPGYSYVQLPNGQIGLVPVSANDQQQQQQQSEKSTVTVTPTQPSPSPKVSVISQPLAQPPTVTPPKQIKQEPSSNEEKIYYLTIGEGDLNRPEVQALLNQNQSSASQNSSVQSDSQVSQQVKFPNVTPTSSVTPAATPVAVTPSPKSEPFVPPAAGGPPPQTPQHSTVVYYSTTSPQPQEVVSPSLLVTDQSKTEG